MYIRAVVHIKKMYEIVEFCSSGGEVYPIYSDRLFTKKQAYIDNADEGRAKLGMSALLNPKRSP